MFIVKCCCFFRYSRYFDGMFKTSPDQTQWLHLYRVKKTSPVNFVLFCSGEIIENGVTTRFLDLRIVSSGQNTLGGSWCERRTNDDRRKQLNRSDYTKFLDLRAKYFIANAIARGIDEIDLEESSEEELTLAVSLDETLRNNLVAIAPTLFPKLARDLIINLDVQQTDGVFEEIHDWAARNMDITPKPSVQECAPMREPLTTKTQRVPV